RILKSAVDRNYVKRVVREQFRRHPIRSLAVDMLVTLQSKKGSSGKRREEGGRWRESLMQLFTDIARRF
ncbi:MAG: ribonuclease P protein component, partial [Usitatibacteraceae bacterium]